MRNLTAASMLALAGLLTLAGCSGVSTLTESQQAMLDAGPYIAEASDEALRACSGAAAVADTIEGNLATFASGQNFMEVEASLLDSMAKSFNAAELTPRYTNIYDAFRTVDNAMLNDDAEAVYYLIDDIIVACSDMTVVDNEELSKRGIDIEPGNVPRVTE